MTVFRFRPRLSNGVTMTERIIEWAALDIDDDIVFG